MKTSSPPRLRLPGLLLLGLALLVPLAAAGATVQVAVASNFSAVAQKMATAFEHDTGHRVRLTAGASGKFYAQIFHGAPFEVLMSADDETPARLEAESQSVPGSRHTYAIGRLVLWSPRADLVDAQGQVLASGRFRHLAIANPKLAPYGAAATETLHRLGLAAQLQPRLVQAETVTQAYQYVVSGNAELGFVAWSQVVQEGSQALRQGSGWLVPASLHRPIRQDAVLLRRGQANPAATAWMQWLRSPPAQRMIRDAGYELP